MASAVNPLVGSSSAAANAASSSASSTGLGATAPTEGVFLELLVSQLKNQDPLNPTDSTTFVSQLAQFSQLEQVIAIRSDSDALAGAVTSAGAKTPGANNSTTQSTSH